MTQMEALGHTPSQWQTQPETSSDCEKLQVNNSGEVHRGGPNWLVVKSTRK